MTAHDYAPRPSTPPRTPADGWPAILRGARADRAARAAAYRDMHPGHIPRPGDPRPDAGSWHEARETIAPIVWTYGPSAATAQRQREAADIAANIARYWRLRDLPARIARHRATGDPETAAYVAGQLTGRELPDPEYRERRCRDHADDAGLSDSWPIIRAARASTD